MLQRIKLGTLSRDFEKIDQKTDITISRSGLVFILKCIALFLLPAGAIALSIASEYLFLKEILSATVLISLVLCVKVAGGNS